MKRQNPAGRWYTRVAHFESKPIVRCFFHVKRFGQTRRGRGADGQNTVSKWLKRLVCVGVLLSPASCISNQPNEVAQTIQKAAYFDFQTRYQTKKALGGFHLTVYHNARERSLGHAGVATLYYLTQKIARQHATQNKREIEPINMDDLRLFALYDEKTHTHYWRADVRVKWVL